VIGLLCTAKGCPIATEVFEGNVGDPSTVAAQSTSSNNNLASSTSLLVGDRGMLTKARIEKTIKPAGLDFITTCVHRRLKASSKRAPLNSRCLRT